MKRTILAALYIVLIAVFISAVSGCAGSSGPYFKRTRQHGAQVHQDRLYNPADCRYTAIDEE